jgi:microcystin-dependent protein
VDLPIGSIIIWAGDEQDVPTSWRVCNGKALKKTDYPDLYSTLGENWVRDEGYNKDFFCIPDLRGVFLRGVNDDRTDGFRDPDVDKRVRLKSDSTIAKDSPGSYQACDIQAHQHNFVVGGGSSGPRSAVSVDTHRESEYPTGAAGQNETRPVNAYVHYLIKVKA